MTSNDDKTLRVEFDTDVNNVYPLSVYITDDRGYQTCLHVRPDEIDPLMACLWLPMSPLVRLVTMTGDYDVKWWNYHEVALLNCGTRKASVLHWKEAVELVGLVRSEMGGKKMTRHMDKRKIGVGIEGRSEYPVRLEFGCQSRFGIKANAAHKLISYIEKYSSDVLIIKSTRGTLEVQFIDEKQLAIENMDDRMLMVFDQDCFEELHRLLTTTVPKLQEFIEKDWDESTKKQLDDNLRGVFG